MVWPLIGIVPERRFLMRVTLYGLIEKWDIYRERCFVYSIYNYSPGLLCSIKYIIHHCRLFLLYILSTDLVNLLPHMLHLDNTLFLNLNQDDFFGGGHSFENNTLKMEHSLKCVTTHLYRDRFSRILLVGKCNLINQSDWLASATLLTNQIGWQVQLYRPIRFLRTSLHLYLISTD